MKRRAKAMRKGKLKVKVIEESGMGSGVSGTDDDGGEGEA